MRGGWRIDSSRQARQAATRLLRRLGENARALQEAHRLLSRGSQHGRNVPESVVWLLDNYYLIEDEIAQPAESLPRKHNTGLPRLSDGPCKGLPRVYELALEFIARLQGQPSHESVHEFIRAYQGISRLNLGELWAFPVMLRLAGIENLRNAALQVLRRQQDGEQGRESDHNQAADEIAVRNGILSLHAPGRLGLEEFCRGKKRRRTDAAARSRGRLRANGL